MRRFFAVMMLFCVTVSMSAAIPSSERQALVALYDATAGAQWTDSDGWKGQEGTECSWYGVTCTGSHVTALELRGNGLSGTLPASLADLPLTRLDLGNNDLGGSVPDLHTLPLTYLSLEANHLSGALPQVSPTIVNLSLGQNQFTGSMHDISTLPNLEGYEIYRNQISGTIISLSAPKLQSLNIGSNQLTGPIPAPLAPNLDSFQAYENQLSGVLPDLSGAPLLQYLDLTNNRLTAPVPRLALTHLIDLRLGVNPLGGPVPDLSGLSNLEEVDIRSANLTGGLPAVVPPKLTYLALSYNSLTGGIPAWNLPGLQSLVLDHNQFTGPAPVLNAPLLTNYDVSYNQLTGPFPALGYPDLQFLIIGGNQMTGSIPVLDQPELRYIQLSANHFSGPLPSLAGVPHLQSLTVDANDLTGPLPDLGQTPELFSLIALDNHFTGPIPPFPAALNMSAYYISQNAITGVIPPSIVNLGSASLSISFNGLRTSDPAVRHYLDAREPGWSARQTAAPEPVFVHQSGLTMLDVSWTSSGSTTVNSFEAQLLDASGSVVASEIDPVGFHGTTFSGLVPGSRYTVRARAISEPSTLNRNRIVSDFTAESNSGLMSEKVDPFPLTGNTLTPLWVDSTNGSDQNDGSTKAKALKTLGAAAAIVNSRATGGFEVILASGGYQQSSVRFSSYGSHERPLIIRSEVPGGAFIGGRVYLEGSSIALIGLYLDADNEYEIWGGPVEDLLIRNCAIRSLYIYHAIRASVETSNLGQLRMEYSSVVSVTGTHIGYNGSFCVRTALMRYLRMEQNDIGPCSTPSAFGTDLGLSLDESPWLHYVAPGLRFVNNVVHDITGGGLVLSGMYDGLIAHNTFVSIGGPQPLISVNLGRRVCGRPSCSDILAAGGWTAAGNTSPAALIPDRNISIVNNVFRSDVATRNSLFGVEAQSSAASQNGTNIPVPTRADDGLVIAGNVIWDGSTTGSRALLNTGGGCAASHPTCSPTAIAASNRIGTFDPQFNDRADGDFHPVQGGNLFGLVSTAIADFTWVDRPLMPLAPKGETSNRVERDADGAIRRVFVPGAFSTPGVRVRQRAD